MKEFADYPELMTAQQVAELLQFKPRTVLLLLREQKLPYIEIGRSKRVVKEELKEFLKSGAKQAVN